MAHALVQEQRGTVVRGRMVQREEGRNEVFPAPRFDYRLQLLNPENRVVSEVGFLPNEDGQFRLTLPWAHPESGPWHAEIVSLWATPKGNQRVRMPLPALPWNRSTAIETGEVEVRMVTHSIHLKLVDGQGRPLPHITVQAQPRRAAPPQSKRVRTRPVRCTWMESGRRRP